MDRTPERLKKELEEELLLSGEDLRSHAWYHGRIPRQVPALFLPGRAPPFSNTSTLRTLPAYPPTPCQSRPQFSQTDRTP